MIEASKRPWFARWFAWIAYRRLRAMFGGAFVAGFSETQAVARDGPVVFVANHSTWWDGLVVSMLSERLLNVDGYVLMDAKNLRKMRFFALCGAFGADLHSTRDGARAMRYAVSLLDRPGRAVWIFPEGKEQPSPLAFRPGAARVAALVRDARVVPVGLRYAFAATEKPQLWIAFGPALGDAQGTEGVALQLRAVQAALSQIDTAMRGGLGDDAGRFEVLWREPAHERLPLAMRALDRLARVLLKDRPALPRGSSR